MDENPPAPPGTPPPPPPRTAAPAPPLIAPTVAARPQSRGRGWMIFSIILLICLGFSMLLNVGSLFSGILHGGGGHYAVRTSGPKLDEYVREDNNASDKIAVVEVNGIITSGMFE